MRVGVPWTRAHLLAAMHLYCITPFGRLHEGNPAIIALAAAMGRTPGSLAMKLTNLASLDPAQQARGIKGLSGASAADRQIWDEFQADWNRLVDESATALEELGHRIAVPLGRVGPPDEPPPAGSTTRVTTVTARRGQDFFRDAVLGAYQSRCCLTGCAVPELLVASHIVPWAERESTRLDPRNGLCLSALYDKAFDRALIAFDDDLRLLVSGRLRRLELDDAVVGDVVRREGQGAAHPVRFRPSAEFLRWHREGPFAGNC
jgi:putative restriction endonuclease